MKINSWLAGSLLIISSAQTLIAARSAMAATQTPHPANFVKDSVITTRVKARLAADSLRSLAHIQVETDDRGRVVLSGNVRTSKDAAQAVRIASRTAGVSAVSSRLKVIGKPPS